MQKPYGFTLSIKIILFCWSALIAEEGMWPLSEIHTLDLNSKGLELEVDELYNPDGISLIDGICKVGGCSGSFVSEEGLILTNHHCAFSAIRKASTPEADYLQNGFLALARDDEIRAEGYEVRITESYRDISEEVLSAISDEVDPADRTQALERRISELEKQVEAEQPGKRAEIAEMFIGKTYVLFIYTYLKDVRLVYAPPGSIGNYGGEIDNWIWPRHTGDFSFMRVYVAPDGSPAEYAPENVPYQPKRVISVAPEGVNDEDFVFILGYPGRTYRHRTSHYLAYEYEVRLPVVVKLYDWEITVLESIGENDREVALKLASHIKGLSNTMKNYRGKLQGIRRIRLLEQKRQEELALQTFINADPERQSKYGTILKEIEVLYDEIRQRADYEFALKYLKRSSVLLNTAYTVYEMSLELKKDDLERESEYQDRNLDRTRERMFLRLKNFYAAADQVRLQNMFEFCATLPPDYHIPPVNKIAGSNKPAKRINRYITKSLAKSRLDDPNYVRSLMDLSVGELAVSKDPFIQLAVALYPVYQQQKEIADIRSGKFDRLHGLLIDIKKEFRAADFVPDANGTLRLTYGHIRGYSPADATFQYPITTLNGVIEKNIGKPPFDLPEKIITLYQNQDFGRYEHPELHSVPVGILYNMDTTGGNSGSAVLNSQGQLVGINFDRVFEATINDFAWNEAYSRSIAVDIRYVLWILEKYSGATSLLSEIGL